MEHYYTIQGEGFNMGKAAYFIRLGGCSVGCHWCDVKESWEANNHKKYTISEICSWVNNTSCDNIVITGGEPTEYDLTELTKELSKQGRNIFIETSAAYPITGKWHWVCISPKKRKLPLQENLILANELKIIIYNNDDFLFAEKYQNMVSSSCLLYLQPEWDKKEEMLPKIIEYVKENPKWRISLQTHKYINIP